MSQYKASVPSDDIVKPEIQAYYETFYKISDTEDAHEKYAEQFTKDATLIIASNQAKGRDDILKMRQGMWEKVSSRSHKPQKIYSFGPSSDEIMLYGTVDYGLRDGRSTVIDWSARAHFSKEGEELKMDFYQVYLDSAAVAKAK